MVKLFSRFSLFVLFISLVGCQQNTKATSDKTLDARDIADVVTQQSFSANQIVDVGEVIWGIDFISSDEMIFSTRSGKLFYYQLGQDAPTQIQGAPSVHVRSQGGLLDVLYKVIEDTPYLYLTFSEGVDGGSTVALGRGVIDSDNKRLENFETLFVANAAASPGRHYGSRLVFDKDGHLFMTVGDRGQRNQAQDPSNHSGTVLRLNADGSYASGNPFLEDDSKLNEIWTYGHRNPQGIDIHPTSGALWTIEFGPKGGDELNHIIPGKNYGWPKMTYGREYSGAYIAPGYVEGMEPALVHWTPAISPSGMTFYKGDVFSEWNGDLFIAALGDTHVHRLVLDGEKIVGKERLFDSLDERVRQIRQGPDGLLYFTTDSGKIYQIAP